MKQPGLLTTGRAAWACWTVAFAAGHVALAEVRFVNIAPDRGIHFAVAYGPAFDFSADPPGVAGMKRIMQRNMGNGAAVGDFDNDGDEDVYILGQTGTANRLYRNDLVSGARVFTDVTANAGVGDLGFGRAAQFVDLDGDGWNDLVLLNDDTADGTAPPSKVYRNNGNGTFTDETPYGFSPTGLIKGGMCMGDYAQSGYPGVYVGLWLMKLGDEGEPGFTGENHLYYNHSDGVILLSDDFVPAISVPLQRDSFSCVFADFDNDADPDLYVAIDHTSDAYYRNDGGVFSDQTVAVGATHTGNDMGISVADFDNDGDLDVYSTNITDPSGTFGTTQDNTLLVNQLVETGTMSFVDEAEERGVRDTYWGWGTEFIDADNDGDLDLYAVNGFDEFIALLGGNAHPLVNTPEVLFINDGTGVFTRSIGTGADFVGDARAAIAFDYNLDGRQDLLVTNMLDPLVLLENRSEPRKNWVSVKLVGACYANTNAIGGRVHVTAGGTTQMREVLAGGSYLAGRSFIQHFGLGDAETIENIRVVFPDGTVFERELPDIVNCRVAILHETPIGPARMMVSHDLSHYARFQRCLGPLGDPPGQGCAALDEAGISDGQIDVLDLPGFLSGLDWTVPGCVPN